MNLGIMEFCLKLACVNLIRVTMAELAPFLKGGQQIGRCALHNVGGVRNLNLVMKEGKKNTDIVFVHVYWYFEFLVACDLCG